MLCGFLGGGYFTEKLQQVLNSCGGRVTVSDWLLTSSKPREAARSRMHGITKPCQALEYSSQ